MSKNVGIVAIPAEYVIENMITPEDLKGRLMLPKGVKVHSTFDDWYRQSYNLMLISDTPVEGATFPTEPGNEVPRARYDFRGNYILVGNRIEEILKTVRA